MQNSERQGVAFVTGGSRGIGAAIVRRRLPKERAVTFTYVSGKEQAEALVRELTGEGLDAVAIHSDNTKEGVRFCGL